MDILILTYAIRIGKFRIPTWSPPIITAFLLALLIWPSSFLGHMCCLAFGYTRKFTFVVTYLGIEANVIP